MECPSFPSQLKQNKYEELQVLHFSQLHATFNLDIVQVCDYNVSKISLDEKNPVISPGTTVQDTKIVILTVHAWMIFSRICTLYC